MLFNHFLYAFAAAMIALQFVANNFSGVQAARPLRIVGNDEDMNSIFQDVESSQKKLARDHPKSAFMNSVNTPEREQRCTVRVQTVGFRLHFLPNFTFTRSNLWLINFLNFDCLTLLKV